MSISASCESCGKQMRLRDEAAGRRVKCSECGAVVQVPEAEGVMDAEAVDDNPFASGDLSSEGDAFNRKPCPACGEMIVNTAAKCRFCGEIFDPALKKKQASSKSFRLSESGADDNMSTGDWVAAILCSGIGCIAGIVWMIQGKPKGTKMFLISLVMVIVWTIVRFAIEAANNPQQFR